MTPGPAPVRAGKGKARSVALLTLCVVLSMSLWFVSSAILPGIVAEVGIAGGRAAALSSAVQLGFVIGALAFAGLGTADRFDPRAVMALSAACAAAFNLLLLAAATGGTAQVALRGLTGFCLAGVYPVGMKIAVGWGARDRGLLVGLLVGAVTLGSSLPHLLAVLGGPDWRTTVVAASALAAAGSLLPTLVGLGPHHARARAFRPAALSLAWTDRRVRLAFAGYLGHMWELYAFWAWIGVAAAASFAAAGHDGAERSVRLLTFAAIAVGAVACVPAGMLADRIGKARIARAAMALSGAAALGAALAFGGPPWLFALMALIWGAAVIPDSAQFSALVADAAPPELAGSLMTLQTALGFALTAVTVQAVPGLAAAIGWPWTLAAMALGPLFGVEAMRRLIRAA